MGQPLVARVTIHNSVVEVVLDDELRGVPLATHIAVRGFPQLAPEGNASRPGVAFAIHVQVADAKGREILGNPRLLCLVALAASLFDLVQRGARVSPRSGNSPWD